MPKREPWVPRTHKFHDMMCSNDFPYHWDQFEYIYNMPRILKNPQTHKLQAPGEPLGGPKVLFKGPGGPLAYQYYDKMCSNEFLYLWDQF